MLKYYNYVTGFAKTVPNFIRTEMQFIAELYAPCKPTLLLYPEKPNTWLWMAKSIKSQIAFRCPCQTIQMHYRVCGVSEWQ